ncbi:MAG: metal-sulfur cluster assembly factor [Balneolaceae bacterium]
MINESDIRSEAATKLKDVIDPELGVNIVDLGLIYQMYLREGKTFVVIYTTTTPGCPMRRYLQRKIEEALQSIKDIDAFETEMVFEPEWTVDMIVEGVEFFSVPPPILSDY